MAAEFIPQQPLSHQVAAVVLMLLAAQVLEPFLVAEALVLPHQLLAQVLPAEGAEGAGTTQTLALLELVVQVAVVLEQTVLPLGQVAPSILVVVVVKAQQAVQVLSFSNTPTPTRQHSLLVLHNPHPLLAASRSARSRQHPQRAKR
jgi:hypothetical protein